MAAQNHSSEETPIFVMRLPGLRIPSRNEIDDMHWSKVHRIRKEWSRFLLRCMYGFYGSYQADRSKTVITRQAALSSFAMQSPRSAAVKVIQRKTVSLGGRSSQRKAPTKSKSKSTKRRK